LVPQSRLFPPAWVNGMLARGNWLKYGRIVANQVKGLSHTYRSFGFWWRQTFRNMLGLTNISWTGPVNGLCDCSTYRPEADFSLDGH
jgi:hypothetical protein